MAFSLREIVSRQDIINEFIDRVRDQVLSGSFATKENPIEVVPYQYLGSLSEFNMSSRMLGVHIGPAVAKGESVYESVYRYLTYMTRMLLKIGTWSETIVDQGRPQNSSTRSGKCIFSDSAVISLFGVSEMDNLPLNIADGGVRSGLPITMNSLSSLLNNCFQAYTLSRKVNYNHYSETCHSDCHSNHDNTETTKGSHTNVCYNGPGPLATDYWGNPNCYLNGTSRGYPAPSCAHRPEHTDSYTGGGTTTTHQDEGSETHTCHVNRSVLSLI